MSKLQKCRQKKVTCFAYTKEGYCKCLKDTRFNYSCPFYKNIHQVQDECPEVLNIGDEDI